jgi:hypothetical protein
MANDFASMSITSIEPVICGDAHLGNFGFYASPERDLVFGLPFSKRTRGARLLSGQTKAR